ncbi:hypothetical protein R3Q06_10615 [Rhodococcus erythropolis]|uniref:hypothetical protein n=1 Tax=Rhodococcus erythropolis TaxID=1833 RepID=UPI002949F787|nr:hypothetical protein [Rhodococcus erythropolis]MDV6273950.1 hypothetical protein [Rhodococcus erythropolis]
MGTTADIARAIHEKHSNGGKVPNYFEEFVGDVLSELRASARLVPAGGMALTAEEWADFLNVIHEGRGDYSSRDRLREKFPTIAPIEAAAQSAGGDCFDVCEGHPINPPAATGPSEERCPTCNDSGDVHRMDGEWLGVCDCPAGAPAPTETGPWPTWQRVPEGVKYKSGAKDWVKAEYVNRSGIRMAVVNGEEYPSTTDESKIQGLAPFVAAVEG